MDQELKQRLIGAAVITALAAIFVPMLFDDPIDETGKSINELKIPEIPAKVQEVDIMPLPEKVEEVAENLPTANAPKEAPVALEEGESEAALEAPKPQTRLTPKDTAPSRVPTAVKPAALAPAIAQTYDEPAEAEDVPPVVTKPGKLPTPSVQQPVSVPPAPKVLKPVSKTPDPKVEASTAPAPVPSSSKAQSAPAAAEESNRWYLQVGTFSQKPNAASLQESLKQQGFAATVKEVASDKGTVFKVRIGPIVDKAKAQAVKAKLAQINVNSFVSAEE